MSERVIGSEKAPDPRRGAPYHRYIADDRPRGTAIVERAYDARCPRCRDEDTVAKRARPG